MDSNENYPQNGVRIRVTDAIGNTISVGSFVTTTDSWVNVSHSFLATERNIRVYIVGDDGSETSGGTEFYVGEVKVEEQLNQTSWCYKNYISDTPTISAQNISGVCIDVGEINHVELYYHYPNLISNFSFEEGNDYYAWSNYQTGAPTSTITEINNEDTKFGANSIRIVAQGINCLYGVCQSGLSTEQDGTYWYSIWYKANSGTGELRFYYDNGEILESVSLSETSWTNVSGLIYPSGNLNIYLGKETNSSVDILFDSVFVEKYGTRNVDTNISVGENGIWNSSSGITICNGKVLQACCFDSTGRGKYSVEVPVLYEPYGTVLRVVSDINAYKNTSQLLNHTFTLENKGSYIEPSGLYYAKLENGIIKNSNYTMQNFSANIPSGWEYTGNSTISENTAYPFDGWSVVDITCETGVLDNPTLISSDYIAIDNTKLYLLSSCLRNLSPGYDISLYSLNIQFFDSNKDLIEEVVVSSGIGPVANADWEVVWGHIYPYGIQHKTSDVRVVEDSRIGTKSILCAAYSDYTDSTKNYAYAGSVGIKSKRNWANRYVVDNTKTYNIEFYIKTLSRKIDNLFCHIWCYDNTGQLVSINKIDIGNSEIPYSTDWQKIEGVLTPAIMGPETDTIRIEIQSSYSETSFLLDSIYIYDSTLGRSHNIVDIQQETGLNHDFSFEQGLEKWDTINSSTDSGIGNSRIFPEGTEYVKIKLYPLIRNSTDYAYRIQIDNVRLTEYNFPASWIEIDLQESQAQWEQLINGSNGFQGVIFKSIGENNKITYNVDGFYLLDSTANFGLFASISDNNLGSKQDVRDGNKNIFFSSLYNKYMIKSLPFTVDVSWNSEDTNLSNIYQVRYGFTNPPTNLANKKDAYYNGINITSMEPGDQTLYISVTNTVGTTETISLDMFYDNIPPSISITNPEINDVFNNRHETTATKINCSGTYSDNVGIDDIFYRIEGGSWTNVFASGGIGDTNGTFIAKDPTNPSNYIPLLPNDADGNTIEVIAYDLVQNYTTDQVEVLRDVAPPTITITSPPYNPNYVSNSNITIEGTLTEQYPGNAAGVSGVSLEYWYNGDMIESHFFAVDNVGNDFSTWSKSITLIGVDEEENVVKVSGVDKTGNWGTSESITIYNIENVPSITVTHLNGTPKYGDTFYTSSTSVSLSGTFTSPFPSGIRIYKDGIDLYPANSGVDIGNWSWESYENIDLSYNQECEIKVVLFDQVGQSGYDIISLVQDSIAPSSLHPDIGISIYSSSEIEAKKDNRADRFPYELDPNDGSKYENWDEFDSHYFYHLPSCNGTIRIICSGIQDKAPGSVSGFAVRYSSLFSDPYDPSDWYTSTYDETNDYYYADITCPSWNSNSVVSGIGIEISTYDMAGNKGELYQTNPYGLGKARIVLYFDSVAPKLVTPSQGTIVSCGLNDTITIRFIDNYDQPEEIDEADTEKYMNPENTFYYEIHNNSKDDPEDYVVLNSGWLNTNYTRPKVSGLVGYNNYDQWVYMYVSGCDQWGNTYNNLHGGENYNIKLYVDSSPPMPKISGEVITGNSFYWPLGQPADTIETLYLEFVPDETHSAYAARNATLNMPTPSYKSDTIFVSGVWTEPWDTFSGMEYRTVLSHVQYPSAGPDVDTYDYVYQDWTSSGFVFNRLGGSSDNIGWWNGEIRVYTTGNPQYNYQRIDFRAFDIFGQCYRPSSNNLIGSGLVMYLNQPESPGTQSGISILAEDDMIYGYHGRYSNGEWESGIFYVSPYSSHIGFCKMDATRQMVSAGGGGEYGYYTQYKENLWLKWKINVPDDEGEGILVNHARIYFYRANDSYLYDSIEEMKLRFGGGVDGHSLQVDDDGNPILLNYPSFPVYWIDDEEASQQWQYNTIGEMNDVDLENEISYIPKQLTTKTLGKGNYWCVVDVTDAFQTFVDDHIGESNVYFGLRFGQFDNFNAQTSGNLYSSIDAHADDLYDGVNPQDYHKEVKWDWFNKPFLLVSYYIIPEEED